MIAGFAGVRWKEVVKLGGLTGGIIKNGVREVVVVGCLGFGPKKMGGLVLFIFWI